MTNTLDTLRVEKLHPHIAALVSGVDLTQPLGESVFNHIRDAFDQYSVLVFRNQAIDDDQQVAFSRRFNDLEKISFSGAAQNPYVYRLSNVDENGHLLGLDTKKRVFLKVNSRWHTDSSFKPVPAMASILSGREIPVSEHADTDFASLRAGYASLPTARREALHALIAVHYYGYSLSLIGGRRTTSGARRPPAEPASDRAPPPRHRQNEFICQWSHRINHRHVPRRRAQTRRRVAAMVYPTRICL